LPRPPIPSCHQRHRLGQITEPSPQPFLLQPKIVAFKFGRRRIANTGKTPLGHTLGEALFTLERPGRIGHIANECEPRVMTVEKVKGTGASERGLIPDGTATVRERTVRAQKMLRGIKENDRHASGQHRHGAGFGFD